MGCAKLRTTDYKGAADAFRMVVALKPDSYMAYFHRGEARESLGDFNGAIEDYNISISINPKAALPYLRRGKLKVSINDINGACLDFYSATELGAPEAYDLVKKYCQM